MKTLILKGILLVFTPLLSLSIQAQNVVIVIIDGARYSETFGDPSASYIPNMAQLAEHGSIINTFYNDSTTYTSAAIPTIWCGTWTQRVDTTYNGGETQYTIRPSIFEYVSKKMDLPQEQCLYSLKYVSSLWLPSFHADYGPEYWPLTISNGNDDADVLENTIAAINDYHPRFLVMYLAEVDQSGHSGNWDQYVNSIQYADEAVNELWQTLQSDQFYKDQTTMIVTNDHGRHDDSHGGFKGHGCSCNGCRQIMFLALGPNIKKNYVSNVYRRLPDVAVTAASIFNLDLEYATGDVASEIFEPNYIEEDQNLIEWNVNSNYILFEEPITGNLKLNVFQINGSLINSDEFFLNNQKMIKWNQHFQAGIYIVSFSMNEETFSQKVIVY